MVRICSKCKREIEEGSISCPHCGLVIGETGGPSASIKDSVIKEIHQTQNIYNESRPLGTPEYQYEKYVLAVLESGGKLERARTQLEQRREQLGLSLKQSKEVEDHCLALNKKAAPPLKSEETGTPKINQNISSSNGNPKTTSQKRLPQWGILVGCIAVLIIGTVVVINNRQTPGRVPLVASPQNAAPSNVSPSSYPSSSGSSNQSTSSEPSVTSYGFSPNPITLGSSANGSITMTGGSAGTYTLVVLKDISLGSDTAIASYSVNYNGATSTKTITFSPSSSGNYYFHIEYGGNIIWSQPNNITRLTVK